MALPGAEGHIAAQLAVGLGTHHADAGTFSVGIVDGHRLAVHRRPVLHLAPLQGIGQTLFHRKGGRVTEGDGQVVVGQLCGLLGDDGQQGVLEAEADEQQGRAACHTQHRHKEPLLIPEQVPGGGLLGEAHTLPQRGDVLQEDALACHGSPGQQQCCTFFLQAGAAGTPGSQADDGGTDGHAGGCHARVEPQGEGGQAEDQLIGVPDNAGEHQKAHHHTGHAAQHAGSKGIEQVLACNAGVGVAQGLQGAHLEAVLVHHTGHGGGSHQGRHQEEEHREHPGNGSHPVGVLLKGHKAQGAVAVQHIPLALFDLAHLLLSIGELLQALVQLLLGIGLLGLVLGTGVCQLLYPGLILLPPGVQLGPGCLKLAVGRGGAGSKLQLAFQQLHLQPPQSGLGLHHQLVVAEVRGGDEPLGVHLLFALIQLGLVALELAVDVVVGGLGLGQSVPQLDVVLVGRLRLVQSLLGVVQGGLGVGQQGVCHLFQVHQQLDLLQLFLKLQHLVFAVHQLVGTVLHGFGQGFLLLGQFRFACVQLGLGLVQLLLGIVQLLLCLGKLPQGFGLLVVVGLTGLGQLLVGGVHELFPALHTLGVADLLQTVRHLVHRLLVLLGIIIVLTGIFRLDITGGVVIRRQFPVQHIGDVVQLTVAHGAALFVGGDVLRVLHQPHHRIFLVFCPLRIFRKSQHGALSDLGLVAHYMDHALVGGLGHPAGAQHQTVHVGVGVRCRVLLQGLQLHHHALLLALPVGLQVQGLYRHHSLHPGGGGNGGNVLV